MMEGIDRVDFVLLNVYIHGSSNPTQPGYILGKKREPPTTTTTTPPDEGKEAPLAVLYEEFLPHVLRQHQQVRERRWCVLWGWVG